MLRGRTQVELYESEGFSHEDAVTVIELLSKHPKKFIDVMMVDELGLMPPSTPAPRHVVPLAVSTLLGTAVGGLLSAESALRMSTKFQTTAETEMTVRACAPPAKTQIRQRHRRRRTHC